jgi:multicomponent Na+:H+ antiporter subunit E
MRRVLLFFFSMIIWYFFAWPFNFETREMDWQILIAGIVVSLIAAIILGEVFLKHKHKHNIFVRLLWAIVYIPVLFFYILMANFDVLYRIIHPLRPINPGIVKVKTRLKTDAGKTMLANSITLTPGTLTVDITDDNYLYVHCINIKEKDMEQATNKIVLRFENYLERIFE